MAPLPISIINYAISLGLGNDYFVVSRQQQTNNNNESIRSDFRFKATALWIIIVLEVTSLASSLEGCDFLVGKQYTTT